ncbi:hypothetical protein NQK81_28310 [Amycolatopsis roodepoortensis]|uniref:hypothetical protein n=1 Tax=Amycolatopsis roodepoortensis TaxID=700274 RepID=UPI00214CF0BC|nr:hypothetical protein [Amycolatopsis roodepoortensis]UUV28675.1 hypothetical protein NQK81_28310 [Amycolatopsis roodepoortensis]
MARDPESLPVAVHAARTVVLAGAAAALGITAHILGGGVIPHIGMTLVIAGLIGWAGTAIADHCRGPIAAIGALAAAQAVLHAVLLLPSQLTHRHIDPVLAEVGPLQVLGVYALAIVLLGLLLTGADTALLAIRGLVWRTLGWIPVPATPPHTPLWSPVLRPDRTNIATDVLLRRSRPRRGPPAFR